MSNFIALLFFTIFLSGCITVTTNGEKKQLTLSGLESKPSLLEMPREQLPRLTIKKLNDGFIANGIRYIDPHGKIIHLSELSDTGFITYTIQGNKRHDYIVKLVNPLTNEEAQTLGILEKKRGLWHFTPKNEKRYSGDWFRLTSRGLLLNRNNNIVTYFSPDSQAKTHILPEGYRFSPLQKGDISQSKHILIQRQIAPRTRLGIITLESSVKRFNLALFNILTGDITSKIHDVRLQSNSDQDQADHLKNTYYLFNTASGTIVATVEDGYERLVLRNLTTGQKKTAFERERGVSFPKAKMHESGRIEISASVGLSTHRIVDAENFLSTGNKLKQLGE